LHLTFAVRDLEDGTVPIFVPLDGAGHYGAASQLDAASGDILDGFAAQNIECYMPCRRLSHTRHDQSDNAESDDKRAESQFHAHVCQSGLKGDAPAEEKVPNVSADRK